MSEPPEDFDPGSRKEREVAAEAAGDRSDFLSSRQAKGEIQSADGADEWN